MTRKDRKPWRRVALAKCCCTKLSISLAFGLLIVSSGGAMAEQRTVTLAVENMYCEACPYMVKKSIAKVPGVSTVTVSLKAKTAVVVFDDARAKVKDLTEAATNAGFPSTPKN